MAKKSRSSGTSSSSSLAPKKPATPTQIAGFSLLGLSLPSSSATHYLYLRAHSSKSDNLPDGRTLFIANVPADVAEEGLRRVFSVCGVVEGVAMAEGSELEEEAEAEAESEEEEEGVVVGTGGEGTVVARRRKRGPKHAPAGPPPIIPLLPLPAQPHRAATTAHLVFLDSSSLTRALSPSFLSSRPALPSPTNPPGLARLLARHAALRPRLSGVKAHADSYIANWEWVRAQTGGPKRERTEREEMMEEGGFTLVERGGKYGRAEGAGGVAVARRVMPTLAKEGEEGKEGRKKKKARMAQELPDFYRWQRREKKRDELAQLRARFEADKAKVEQLKAQRRFKPY